MLRKIIVAGIAIVAFGQFSGAAAQTQPTIPLIFIPPAPQITAPTPNQIIILPNIDTTITPAPPTAILPNAQAPSATALGQVWFI